MSSSLEKRFRLAKNRPILRQNFLDEFSLNHSSPYVKKLVYNAGEDFISYLDDAGILLDGDFFGDNAKPFRKELSSEYNPLATCSWEFSKFGKHIQQVISVYPVMFLHSYKFLRHILKNHEYFHAQNSFKGIILPSGNKIDYSNIKEIPTQWNEFRGLRYHDFGLNPQEDISELSALTNEFKELKKINSAGLKRESNHIARDIKFYLYKYYPLLVHELQKSIKNNKQTILGEYLSMVISNAEEALAL